MSNAKVIAKSLKELGVKKVYLYPGGTIAPLLDELLKHDIEYYCAKTEQGAGYMAIGAAKITRQTQVVLVTSGPGATNLVTPIADAYFDSIPILVITGQVATTSMNNEKKIRQTGFQEIDSVGIYSNITKSSRVASLDDDMSKIIFESFKLTTEKRFGPVHIDLPMDVQKADEKISGILINELGKQIESVIKKETLDSIKNYISSSLRPLFFVGNGVLLSDAVLLFREVANKTNIPVVSSLPGVSIMSSESINYVGFIGYSGEFFANLAMYHSDLLIVIGSRLDIRQTGSEYNSFSQGKKIIRIDIDTQELEFSKILADISVKVDIQIFLRELLKQGVERKDTHKWMTQINNWKEQFNSEQFYNDSKFNSFKIIKKVSAKLKDRKVIVTTGVGCHQQFVARYFSFDYPNKIWMTSAGHGTMGFDLPVNIGAVMSAGSDYVGVVFVGDGSFQMNLQELAMVKEYELPIKIFVFDDNSLNLVAQFQNMNWKCAPSTENKINPSFSAIAKAYGLESYDIYNEEELNIVVKDIFKDNKPALVHCHITSCENVLPMLLGGQKLNEMYPFEGAVKL